MSSNRYMWPRQIKRAASQSQVAPSSFKDLAIGTAFTFSGERNRRDQTIQRGSVDQGQHVEVPARAGRREGKGAVVASTGVHMVEEVCIADGGGRQRGMIGAPRFRRIRRQLDARCRAPEGGAAVIIKNATDKTIEWSATEGKLLCIDITGVIVKREPMGDGYQCHVEGNPGHWSRGDSIDEAIGGLIRRLAVEHEGANFRRRQKDKETTTEPSRPE